MGGYGGALKQLSIGIASSYGKAYIHGVGDPAKLWTADHDSFLASMADAASSVIDYFKGNAVYINVMKNMSVDCDCCAVAEDPCMKDIGILASDDPVAIDQDGLRRIQALRTLTTESTAVLIPFRAQEILQNGGIYYGQNAVSKNMIVADRRKLLNGNSFRLGVSGSGKSFSAKEEIVSIALSTNDDILILDPESEFGFLVEALGGEVIRAVSYTHLPSGGNGREKGGPVLLYS